MGKEDKHTTPNSSAKPSKLFTKKAIVLAVVVVVLALGAGLCYVLVVQNAEQQKPDRWGITPAERHDINYVVSASGVVESVDEDTISFRLDNSHEVKKLAVAKDTVFRFGPNYDVVGRDKVKVGQKALISYDSSENSLREVSLDYGVPDGS